MVRTHYLRFQEGQRGVAVEGHRQGTRFFLHRGVILLVQDPRVGSERGEEDAGKGGEGGRDRDRKEERAGHRQHGVNSKVYASLSGIGY